MPNIIKECKLHGTTDFVLEGRGYYRCKKCRVEAVTRNRVNRKKKLIEHFGGKCAICGYSKCQGVLHFHHLDPSKKSFGMADKGVTRSWEAAIAEASKCIILCANCHGEVENGVTQIPEEYASSIRSKAR